MARGEKNFQHRIKSNFYQTPKWRTGWSHFLLWLHSLTSASILLAIWKQLDPNICKHGRPDQVFLVRYDNNSPSVQVQDCRGGSAEGLPPKRPQDHNNLYDLVLLSLRLVQLDKSRPYQDRQHFQAIACPQDIFWSPEGHVTDEGQVFGFVELRDQFLAGRSQSGVRFTEEHHRNRYARRLGRN